MSKTHKNATISFHIPDNYRREIDARAKASGMLNAVIELLDGAKYLWESEEAKQPYA